MSVFPKRSNNWVYRIFERRAVSIKAKNLDVRKIAAVDLQTSLPFGIEVPADISMEDVEIDTAYFVGLKVYTARDVTGVAPENIEFFKVVDVNQSIEDFIKAYWLYPKLIKFELSKVESL
ncbi:MAG: hypothetical protein NWF00_04495 [Candidatus Bathyarchaeota archaeon]|nr:hypothetical protein [Candidatus Bathyarchaeota archaeon]